MRSSNVDDGTSESKSNNESALYTDNVESTSKKTSTGKEESSSVEETNRGTGFPGINIGSFGREPKEEYKTGYYDEDSDDEAENSESDSDSEESK